MCASSATPQRLWPAKLSDCGLRTHPTPDLIRVKHPFLVSLLISSGPCPCKRSLGLHACSRSPFIIISLALRPPSSSHCARGAERSLLLLRTLCQVRVDIGGSVCVLAACNRIVHETSQCMSFDVCVCVCVRRLWGPAACVKSVYTISPQWAPGRHHAQALGTHLSGTSTAPVYDCDNSLCFGSVCKLGAALTDSPIVGDTTHQGEHMPGLEPSLLAKALHASHAKETSPAHAPQILASRVRAMSGFRRGFFDPPSCGSKPISIRARQRHMSACAQQCFVGDDRLVLLSGWPQVAKARTCAESRAV